MKSYRNIILQGLAAIFLMVGISVNCLSHAAPPSENDEGRRAASDDACLPVTPSVRRFLEKFIFPGPTSVPVWASERIAGKDGLLPELDHISGRSEIKALTDPDDTETCRELNSRFTEDLSAKWKPLDRGGETWYRYDIGYLKAGEFIFVVMKPTEPPQPDNPNLVMVTTARAKIIVLDSSLNQIKSWLG